MNNASTPIKLDSRNSLKNLNKTQKDDYIRTLLYAVESRTDSELTIVTEENFNVGLFSGDGSAINSTITKMIMPCLNSFIEVSIGGMVKDYNRNLILFETTIMANSVTVRWSK